MGQDHVNGWRVALVLIFALPLGGALLVLTGGALVGQTTDVAGQIARTEELLRSARELRDRLMADPQRPAYHFMPPAGWMNDINGTVFWRGRYHLFYQAYPDSAHWNAICWGHASSVDLVHWVHHPIILSPTPGGPDREGCFSGVVVIHDGVPTAVYHGAPDGTCLATSTDDLLIHWAKHAANPVLPVPREGDPHFGEYIVYDPCAWQEGNTWYLLCGGTRPQGLDTAYLFRSADLVNWEYVRPFYEPKPEWTELGEDCAVPTFFPLGRRYMLLFVSHKYGCQYYLGRHPHERFIPEVHGRMNWAGGQLIAPMNMLDAKGRRMMFGWVCEARRDASSRAAGWAGVMTLPRILRLGRDGQLRIEPVPEIEVLRQDHHAETGIALVSGAERTLPDVSGDCLEIDLEWEVGAAKEVGLAVRCAPDDAERTEIVYSAQDKTLRVDTSKSSLSGDVVRPWPCPWGVMYDDPLAARVLPFDSEPSTISDVPVQVAPLELSPGEPLRLRIFIDRSILEVFANGRQCVTQRFYPSRPDSLGVKLFAREGAAKVTRLDAWRMDPAAE
jgi:beta-fructofuranosidase